MNLTPSPLHFNPLRPSRDHLASVSWANSAAPRSINSPFAYTNDPVIIDDATPSTAPENGAYNPHTQRWEFPDGPVEMGVYTKTRGSGTGVPMPSTHDWPDYNYVTDDACM